MPIIRWVYTLLYKYDQMSSDVHYGYKWLGPVFSYKLRYIVGFGLNTDCELFQFGVHYKQDRPTYINVALIFCQSHRLWVIVKTTLVYCTPFAGIERVMFNAGPLATADMFEGSGKNIIFIMILWEVRPMHYEYVACVI